MTDYIVEQQGGFKEGRSTMEQLMILRIIMKHYKYRLKKPLYMIFLDFSKAFDTVWHDGLKFKLIEIGINGPLYQIISDSMDGIQTTVTVDDVQSDMIDCDRNIRQ